MYLYFQDPEMEYMKYTVYIFGDGIVSGYHAVLLRRGRLGHFFGCTDAGVGATVKSGH